MTYQINTRYQPDLAYSSHLQSIQSLAACAAANSCITGWRGYAPTPLISLDEIAKTLNVSQILYKDESTRFADEGLHSFKALGGAYAVYRQLESAILANHPDATVTPTVAPTVTPDAMQRGDFRPITNTITVTTATDGNHGRSVAWGAQRFGCRCVIYLHAHVSQGREDAIARYGAKIVRITGDYDDSVRQAAEDARAHGRIVISDTSYPGYTDIPKTVMQGYGVMMDEILTQLPNNEAPTHMFIQGGVGGLPAAMLAWAWETWGKTKRSNAPACIIVEPERAACLFASAKAGAPTTVPGPHDTCMAGLACGEISPLAWEILSPGANAFMTIPDDAACNAMRQLAALENPIIAGESATAGLAGLHAAAANPKWRKMLTINEKSRILLFGTEGATDPDCYKAIVGKSPEAILSDTKINA